MLVESALLDAHITLSETLRDTHYGHAITTYNEPPSPVDFSRAVGSNTPFVVKGAARHWPAIDPQSTHRWTNEYLLRKLGSKEVTVSLTTNGYADSVVWISQDGRKVQDGMIVLEEKEGEDKQAYKHDIYPNGVGLRPGDGGDFFFATPLDIQMPFHKVLSYMKSFDSSPISHGTKPIAFCQLQNDCLRGPEYSSLLADVPDAIPPWAASVLGTEPEAVNFWMGRHESVTSLHSDPYENIYTVIRGAKIFTLYPPCDLFFFHKQEFETAQWLPVKDGQLTNAGIPQVALVSSQEAGKSHSCIPWIPITHPELPAPNYTRFAHAPKPFMVRVDAGDSLYLPRGWLHHVKQEEDKYGVCIAVNAWYEGWEGMGLAWGWAEYAKKMEDNAATTGGTGACYVDTRPSA